MSNKPDIRATITADPSGFVKGVAVAQGALGKLQTELGALEAASAAGFSMAGLAGIGLSATAAAAALLAVTRAAANYGDALDNMSQRTGIAVEELSKWQWAAKMSDISNEDFGKGLGKLSGLIVAAAGGAETSGALFEKYGISVTNADGSVREASEALADLAEIISVMPDGTAKSAVAAEFFGDKLGQKLIPMLNQGKEGLQDLADEAERLGLVMSKDQAKAAAEFNDNLDRLAALAKGVAVAIGGPVIEALNTFIQKLFFARDAQLSFVQVLDVTRAGQDPARRIKEITAELDRLKAARADQRSDWGFYDDSYDEDIAKQERLLAYFSAMQAQQTKEIERETKKREVMAEQLEAKQAQLEKLRAIAAGEASADILKSDKDLNAARIKDAEKLRDALRAAYEASARDAKTAAEEAVKLLDKANGKRTGAADKAFDAATKGLSPEDAAAANAAQAQSLFDQGRYAAAAAGAAKLDGRLKQMEVYQKQAEQYLDRAQAFAEKSGDSGMAQDIAEHQARLYEEQAKAKQQEAADLEKRAAQQMATLNEVEAKLSALNKLAVEFEIKSNIAELESQIGNLKKAIAEGADMPIRTKVEAATADAAPKPASGETPPGFARGGFTGWGHKYQPAGIVHAGEFVHRQEVVRQPGALAFLSLFNKVGMDALKGYATGGLVERMALPTLPGSSLTAGGSRTPLVLDFGKLGRYQAEATPDTAQALTLAVRRAALAQGRR